jgi:PAS domain S-box-containing protein
VIGRLFHKGTLERNFAVSTALLVVALIGATLLVVHARVYNTLRRNLEARGYSIARSIGAVATPSLLSYNYAALKVAAEGSSEDPGVLYVVIHDKEGQVAGVAGSLFPQDAEKQLAQPLSERGSSVVEVAAGGGIHDTALELAVPVFVEGVTEPWGTVRVGLSYAPVVAELRRLELGLLVLGIILAIGAVAGVRWMARRITAPLRQLVAGTEALSKGDLGHRIPVSGVEELSELARSFNTMSDRVQEKARESQEFQQALEALNSTLEEQVRERTRALEESEEQYKTLVEHSPDSILIVQDQQVRFINHAFTDTFGLAEDAVLRREFRLESIFEPESADLVRDRIRAWQRGEHAVPVEVTGRDSRGEPRELELRGSRIEYLGRPAAECLLIDTTETKRLREQLNETEKLRALGELASGVAHDFNNLLGAILGRAQLLRRQAFDADVDEDLAIIEQAARDGRETVLRIQEFSRMRRDRQLTPVDLGDVFRDAIEITRTCWKTEAEKRNVGIDIDLDAATVPPVLGNASELREVATNLILNAVDAMPDGGRIEVRCRRERDHVVARIADDGVGMTEDIRRHLFDPFYSTKGHFGTGLGLSVVYGIVTRHEGRIDVETEPGRGTTFHLRFPVAEGPFDSAPVDEPAPDPHQPGRILVIDDECFIAELLEETLSAAGHTVDVALSGLDGVRKALASPYDLVFTDLGMPDLSGWEVAARVLDGKPDAAIVLVTGWGATLDDAEVRANGIRSVVHKPFEIDELTRTTARLLKDVREDAA